MKARSLILITLGWIGLTVSACGDDGRLPAIPEADDNRSSGAALESSSLAVQRSRYRAIVESIEAERAQLQAPGVSVAIVEHGKLTFARGFGQKHPERDDPVLPSTLFRIGSITKMLTATGLLQLVENGDVNLNAPITLYVPEFKLDRDPAWAPSIRVRHLLTHSSGLSDYGEVGPPDQSDSMLFDFVTGDTFTQSEYLMAPPGRMYNYSNPNFMLAGLITERVSGTYYREYMQEKVFAPLGMSRTIFLGDEVESDGDYAWGKTVDWQNRSGALALAGPHSYDSVASRPAGFAWSSVLDLAKFAQFLMDGNRSVLAKRLVTSMRAPQVNTEEYLDIAYYGYGIAVTKGAVWEDKLYPMHAIEHGGAIPGFAAYLYAIPAQGFAFITLANTDGAYFVQSLATAVRTLVDLPDPLPAPDPGVDPATFGIYAGKYYDPDYAGTIEISTDGKDLFATVPALDQNQVDYEHRLQCHVRHNCVFTMHGTSGDTTFALTFILDKTGNAEYLRARQFVAKRVVDQADSGGGVRPGHGGHRLPRLHTSTAHPVDTLPPGAFLWESRRPDVPR